MASLVIVGKSSVGKSSLIHHICGNNDLIKVDVFNKERIIQEYKLETLDKTELCIIDTPGFSDPKGPKQVGDIFSHKIFLCTNFFGCGPKRPAFFIKNKKNVKIPKRPAFVL